ncbi:MAG TPA: glycosyltransferase family 1 protein, partial [Patescibacteria group bacterium]|nr:glycosyltransferase family 1 protein [Patescibacteria group bacterium]
RGIRAAQHIVAMSEHTKQDIVREFNIPEHTLSVAYPAVAPHFRVPITEETVKTVLQKYHLALGYIYHGGGLEVRKNTETVLRAYKVLVTKNPTLPPLVISGKIFPVSNALATDVRGLVATLGLQERVQLLGFIPDADLPALYKGARVFIYSSLYEGFGLPVLEALCVGVPTIASSAASLPEVGGNAVVYVNPHNVGAVAEAIERVINDRGTRETLIARGVSHIYQFRWDIFVQKIFAHIIQ